ncbi:complex I assembly factor TIMMDC1, mitochondrial isoform X1 [Myxocyprinus asiaticus]|uniref:complex I assembly factor TIMMDC1, mitochondrial isoform X1 n=1 Tax=Myxocyprinus asiaticus TaxID=70543 RepID=UPI0022223B6F|nr:complex I assembly factor TIMMDC1, mitochondrial isoform X1 [Myxocyprinus asiaticus]XP_051558507.1 complex I assembly factor TIMMDC1, mitochondrial isoform X1 [Myxocyprinus asiaticus]XP_051558508.1 complex I assembly factor TIMMDC1, mitochondrial isoform X1 [Myxocyprinus asiaticus]XP_051558509.1 complex I assembly factor TIMMDC1, mitochondrial isoform X1 [Myxocyprinus asiaticus]
MMHTARQQGLSTTYRGTDAERLMRSHPGLLSGLFGFTLPCVHAAESASIQTSISSLPQHIGKPEFPDTGWDRIKDIFFRGDGQMYSEELRSIVKSGIAAAMLGMVYGGLPGARHARERFIQLSQAEIYQNRVDAVRSAHNAAIRGFVRFGWRWSWRVAAFVTLFKSSQALSGWIGTVSGQPFSGLSRDVRLGSSPGSGWATQGHSQSCPQATFALSWLCAWGHCPVGSTVSTGLTVYRDKNDLSHFATAGAVTGGVFRLNLGFRGLLAGTAIGGALGLPAGVLIMGLQKLGGETLCDKRRRERKELHELRVTEWNARLKLTDDLIGEIRGQDQDADIDLQRIEELLNQHRNEKGAQGSDNK